MISKNQDQINYITYGQMNLINDFRKLWTEMTIWLRSYIVSTLTGFSNIDAIKNRLFRIPGEFKALLQPYFGVEISDQFQQLLLMFIVHAQTLITAVKENDQDASNAAVVSLYKTTDDIAEFLARINPYWNQGQWQNLLYQLIEIGIAELMALVAGEYEQEINIRDRMLKQALLLGDYMANGVMYYLLPERFEPKNVGNPI